jgi:hypothetical protein
MNQQSAKNFIDLIGQSFGELVVMKRLPNTEKGSAQWLCSCSCGGEAKTSTSHLKSGHTQSCGHIAKERMLRAHTKAPGHAAKVNVFNSYKHGAKKLKREFSLSFDELIEIASQHCHYCGKEPLQLVTKRGINGNFPHNGIDRKDNSQGYTLENALPCCWRCNRIKRDMSYDEFITFIREVKDHLDL